MTDLRERACSAFRGHPRADSGRSPCSARPPGALRGKGIDRPGELRAGNDCRADLRAPWDADSTADLACLLACLLAKQQSRPCVCPINPAREIFMLVFSNTSPAAESRVRLPFLLSRPMVARKEPGGPARFGCPSSMGSYSLPPTAWCASISRRARISAR